MIKQLQGCAYAALICLLMAGCARNETMYILTESREQTKAAGETEATGESEGSAETGDTGQENIGAAQAPAGQEGGGREAPGYGEGQENSDKRDIYVHVCGAVNSEGVVCIPEGSRAFEAVEAAGGLAPEADAAGINLALQLTDGQKLYVPAVGEAPEGAEEFDAMEGRSAAEEAGRININTADAESLCTLPGIGKSRAADIIAYREAHGAFRAEADIMKVSGIKDSTYEKLKDRIKVR